MTEPGPPQPVTPAAPDLTFDRVEPTLNVPHDTATETAGIPCASCGAVMLDEYYSVGDKPLCASCRTTFEKTRATSRTSKAFGKALAFGLGAALAGAVVYYAVIALLDLEIGIVAILIGWMVGRAILKALPGGGLRRYQVLGAVLTYFAVGLAYLPLVFNSKNQESAAQQQDSTAVAAQPEQPAVSPSAASSTVSPSTPTTASADSTTGTSSGSFLLGLGALAAFAFALPVMMAFSSGGGILSALIIAIGMHQAWRMTGASGLAVTGPFRVGNEPVIPGAT
jgi:hypothetical protein